MYFYVLLPVLLVKIFLRPTACHLRVRENVLLHVFVCRIADIKLTENPRFSLARTEHVQDLTGASPQAPPTTYVHHIWFGAFGCRISGHHLHGLRLLRLLLLVQVQHLRAVQIDGNITRLSSSDETKHKDMI